MHKEPLHDFYDYYDAKYYPKFLDDTFSQNNAIYWRDAGERIHSSLKFYWHRASDIFDSEKHSLFGELGIRPQDVRQGLLADCWIMSAASALSEHPGRLEQVFLNNVNELSPNGIYAVNLYTLGVPHTVIVDDYLPMRSSDGKTGTWFAGLGTDGSLWGPILEKAFAKFHGNYLHLNMGHPYLAVRTLYGSPSNTYKNEKLNS